MLAVHVVSGLMFGGGQQVALDLVGGLNALGIGTQLCALGRVAGSPVDRLANMWVTYDGRYNRAWSLLRSARALRRVFRKRLALMWCIRMVGMQM